MSVSVVLHVLVALVWWRVSAAPEDDHRTTVDIELAPPPPKVEALPAEVARPPESAPEAATTAATSPAAAAEPEPDGDIALHDAGVDAPVDAAVDAPVDAPAKKRRRPDAAESLDGGLDADAGADAGIDAGDPMVATTGASDAGVEGDGGSDDTSDAGATQIAATETGSGAGSGTGTGSGDGSGVAAATEQGSGSGVAGVDSQPAVDGAPTTAGTAANLIAYFPAGHQVTALVRFDRLRNTEWAVPAERLFKPMPDYQLLFGARAVGVADKVDTLVISSPRPQDATATTLVVRSALPRPKLREFLTNAATPIAWSATRGGMLGKRSGRLVPGDKRVLLSPWRDWIVLAPPDDVRGLTTPVRGSLDTIEAKAKLPPWLQTIRTIEQESGGADPRGPALVLTLAGPGTRYDIPDVGLGVTSLPSPERISLAMELVTQGWLIRGNIVFASEADAIELEQSLRDVQQRITDSRILSGLLRRQHALNLVTNLSLSRTGSRVSYSTSMSIADARALLAAAAVTLDAYFRGQAPALPSP